MAERSEGHEVNIEVPPGGRPRVVVDGLEITDRVVGPDGSVRIDQPGMSMRIQAGAGDGSTPPPLPPQSAAVTPRKLEATGGGADDETQQATVIQTQTVNISAGGAVTVFLTQNAQVSQNQANLTCKKKKRPC